MKKWLVILILALLLTGCDKKQETDAKEERPKQTIVESVEDATEETEETEESLTQTEESKEAIEESTETGEETAEQIEDSTEPIVESTEAIEQEEPLSQEGLQKVEFYFPNSNVEEIPEELLVGMSADSLRIARNEIYARHGYIFHDGVLSNYFDNCSWYEQTMDWSVTFDESILNPVEKLNIQKIQAAEARTRLAAPVPASDLVTIIACWYMDGGEFFCIYIENGCLYYESICDESGGIFTYTGTVDNMQKLPGFSNIKRMKTYNLGTGVDPTPFLITEDGEVYLVHNAYASSRDGLQIERFDTLADYQVEDILSFDGELWYIIEVLLKDGSIITVESEHYD